MRKGKIMSTNKNNIKDNIKINNIQINLSAEKIEMICNALNHYGQNVANSIGYSEGEKYWNLIDEIKSKC